MTNPELKFHLHLKDVDELVEILLDTMAHNNGLCMDEPAEQCALARAIVENLTGEPLKMQDVGRCITCGEKLQDPANLRCADCFGEEE